MPRLCIVTDSTAQFSQSDFPALELVHVAAFDLKKAMPQKTAPVRLPAGTSPTLPALEPVAVPPTEQSFLRLFRELSREHDAVLVLTLSSHLSPVASRAAAAATHLHSSTQIDVLDTHTTSIALGWLVELAGSAAQAGEKVASIIKQVRAAMRRIYFLLHIPDLDALARSGQISLAQALAGSMLGILPIFTLEEGRLVPLQKVRSHRAVLEFFEEFLNEFDSPEQVALLRGSSQGSPRPSPLCQRIRACHPHTPIREHTFTPTLQALLGSRALGMAIMQKGWK